MKTSRTNVYIVQPGDHLYFIAKKFNTTIESIVSLNKLVSPMLYVGQTLFIPNQIAVREGRQMQYKPVTAYTATRPIYVNGVDINTGLYPVLNFKPEGATYPYIYVPIAEFSRVGAQVLWDPVNQVINVTSDYDELKSRVETLTAENQYLQSLINDIQMVEQGNTAGNIMNTGFLGNENDWIYFNKRQGQEVYGALTKKKTDLTMDTLLTASVDPTYINVLDGWVYYRSGWDNGNIFKIRIDGTEKTQINNDSSTSILVRGEWIFYANQSDGAKLYKIRADGTERTKLNEDQSSSINLIGEWIYYQNITDQQKPYRVRIDGTERTKLNDTSVYSMLIHDNWIYFRNPADETRIYRMSFDGSNKMRLSNDSASNLNISNGWIYYTTVDIPGGDLYKMRVDGTEKTFLNEEFVTNIIIFDDWIYYTRIEKMIYRIRTDGTQKQTLY
ncbi:DUF5050 domain-containing protein [Bacillus sp. Marseille-P3661]|uniref:DUF5050 domain-containing protein n=1 Tax=Bacillus sp. Marseille-P3661 TaxID=1936234 RepID=UPI0015E1AA6F|nr:DUF5050 domain-containing protein [Bacillus sp. Marseille-P3661]